MDRKPTEAEKAGARKLAAERNEVLFFVPIAGTKATGLVYQTGALYTADNLDFAGAKAWSTWNTGEAS